MKKWRVIEITKIIGILILTLCFQDSYCQPRQEVIKLSIVNKKRSYRTSDTINFNFLNVSGTKLWFIAGFEVLDEGKWKEMI